MSHPLQIWAKTDPILSSEILKPLDTNEINLRLKFATSHTWRDCDRIDIRQVLGTLHPDYAGMTWAELLEKGRRMSINLQLLDSNPGYYLDKDNKKEPSQYFIIIDSQVFIGSDGNHRTAIANAYFKKNNIEPILYGVTVDIYEINNFLYAAYQKLWELSMVHGFHVSVSSILDYREDAPGYMKDYYKNKIEVIGYNGNRKFIKERHIEEIINESTKAFKRWTGKYKFLWK